MLSALWSFITLHCHSTCLCHKGYKTTFWIPKSSLFNPLSLFTRQNLTLDTCSHLSLTMLFLTPPRIYCFLLLCHFCLLLLCLPFFSLYLLLCSSHHHSLLFQQPIFKGFLFVTFQDSACFHLLWFLFFFFFGVPSFVVSHALHCVCPSSIYISFSYVKC